MQTIWKWLLGIALALTVLIVVPFVWVSILPSNGYRMMGYGTGWHMPMGFGGSGMMGPAMFVLWLIPPALLVLIGLAIAWLARALSTPR